MLANVPRNNVMVPQNTLMRFRPTDRLPYPYPSRASDFREYHGDHPWFYNPWTGLHRDDKDVAADPFGHLIVPHGEQVCADTGDNIGKIAVACGDFSKANAGR